MRDGDDDEWVRPAVDREREAREAAEAQVILRRMEEDRGANAKAARTKAVAAASPAPVAQVYYTSTPGAWTEERSRESRRQLQEATAQWLAQRGRKVTPC
jgi:hypothetical protein